MRKEYDLSKLAVRGRYYPRMNAPMAGALADLALVETTVKKALEGLPVEITTKVVVQTLANQSPQTNVTVRIWYGPGLYDEVHGHHSHQELANRCRLIAESTMEKMKGLVKDWRRRKPNR